MSTMSNRKWETDAARLSDYSVFDRLVFKNNSVEEFLLRDSKYFVIAAKGIGKTLLLSYKRYLLEQQFAEDGKHLSVTFIPAEHSFVSFADSIKTTLSSEYMASFIDWEYCKKFWVLVIELTVISNVNFDISGIQNDLSQQNARQKKFLKDLLQKARTVDFILNELIAMDASALTRFVNAVSNAVGFAYGSINSAVYIFLDRLDNALEVSHDSIWTPIQVGLLEAAWDVMNINRHVKIYLSIRQEAYSNHNSRAMNQISASTILVNYSDEDLRKLLNHLVQFYEGKSTIEEMLGFDTFPNTVTYRDENVFEFMNRYSVGRPRDFVEFCDAFSVMLKDSRDGFSKYDVRMKFKEQVRLISSNQIIGNLFDEIRMCLKCLTTKEAFDHFLSLLKTNVLNYNDIQKICKQLNVDFCKGNCMSCGPENHPFCDLYNMGLLGIIDSSVNSRIKKQKFKKPDEFMTYGLRSGEGYYLIHPALREYINRLHRQTELKNNYKMMLGILVGNEQDWSYQDTELFHVNRLISEVVDRKISDFFYDQFERNLKSRKRLRFALKNYNAIITGKRYPLIEQRNMDSLVRYFITGKLSLPKPISVFISYANDNNKHKQRVESFNQMLIDMGFDSHMDSSLKEDYPDIDQMMTVGLSMDKIVIILSKEYKRKADNQVGGVWKEFKMIADDLEEHPQKYIFVSFDAFSSELKQLTSPKRIGNRWIVDLYKGKQDNYNELVAYIKEEKDYGFGKVNKDVVAIHPKPIAPFD